MSNRTKILRLRSAHNPVIEIPLNGKDGDEWNVEYGIRDMNKYLESPIEAEIILHRALNVTPETETGAQAKPKSEDVRGIFGNVETAATAAGGEK